MKFKNWTLYQIRYTCDDFDITPKMLRDFVPSHILLVIAGNVFPIGNMVISSWVKYLEINKYIHSSACTMNILYVISFISNFEYDICTTYLHKVSVYGCKVIKHISPTP